MSYVAKITIDHTKVPSSLTDFPIYVNLADLPSSFWSTVKNGGGDIRCYKSDGTTELAREIVHCKRLTDDLLSYYGFANGSYATDSIGGRTLTTTGSTQQSSGFNGYCGSGDNVAVTSNMGLTGTDDVTINWKAKMTTDITSGGVGFMFMCSTLTTDRLLAMDYDYNGGTRRLNIYNANNSISASFNVTLGTGWHSFTLVRRNGKVSLFIDAVRSVSDASAGSQTGGQNALYLGTGKAYGGSSNYWYDELAIWSRALTDQEIINIHNGGTGLFFSSFATSYTGEMHVKYAGTLSSSVDTLIQIHTDGTSSEPSVSATYGRNAVWSDYFSVHHLSEVAGNTIDSTGNSRVLTDNGNVGGGVGKLLSGRTFDGSTQYLSSSSASIDLNTAFTIQGWIKTSNVTAHQKAFWVGESDSNGSIEIETDAGNPNIRCTVWNGGSSNLTATSAISNNVDYMLHASKTSTTLTFYKNASSVGTATASGWSGSAGSNLMAVGRHGNASANYFLGTIDEFRLRQSALSADWITAEYNNQNSPATFYTASTGSTDVSISATVVTATFSSPARTVSGGANVSATVQTAVFSSPARTVTGTANVTAGVVSAVFSIPAVNIITPDARVNVGVLSAVFSIPAMTVRISTTVSQGTPPSAVFSIPSATVRIGFTHNASVLSAVFSIPTPTVTSISNVTVSASVLTATFSLPSRTVTAEQNAIFYPNALSATFTIPAISVTTVRNISFSAPVLSATFSILTPRKVGGLWTAQPRYEPEGAWTPQARAN